MVPKGWEVKSLGEIATVTSGGTPSRDIPDYWTNGTIPWIRTSEVQNCVLNYKDTREFISQSGLKHSSAKLVPEGTILLAMIGQGKTRGQVALLKFKAATNQNCAAIIPDENTDPVFLFNLLISRYKSIRAISNSAGQSNLSGQLVKQIKVSLPPLPEQRKIGQILSTWDKAIESLEKLIDNCRAEKKALMQQLLHKKTRLSGFSDYWKTYRLGDCCQICTGSKDLKDKQEEGLYPFFVRSKKVEKIDTYSFDGEAILVPGEGGVGEIIHYIKGKFDYHQRVYKLSDFEGLDGLFLYYYLQEFFKREVSQNAVKATVDSLRLPIFKEMRVVAPPKLKEQQRIARILRKVDNLTFNYEQQLSAAKSIKAFLMQQLLTGKRRVKVQNGKATKAVA